MKRAKRAITPDDFPWFDYSGYSFSLGLDLGGLALLSGHSASRYDPSQGRIVVDGGMAEQAITAWKKIEAILGGAGFSLGDVVRVVEHVTVEGIDDHAESERVRSDVLGDAEPAVNTVVVHRLLRPAALIEIEVTASRESGTAYRVGSDGRAAFAPARAVGDVVYLSTIHPYDADGELVGDGDVVAQTRQIFENAATWLAACGLGMDRVVKTLEMIHPDGLHDYKGTGDVRREYLGPVYPGAAGILQDRVAADDRVLISYDFIASDVPIEGVNPGWERYAKLTYSPAVRAGDNLFMSGQAALDPETERALHPGDVAAQAEYTYSNIVRVLDAAGMSPSDLVKTVEYVTPDGLARYREVAGVRKSLLSAPWPASTGVVCHSLLRRDFLIEVDPFAIAMPAVAR